jgi:hypothetical protein
MQWRVIKRCEREWAVLRAGRRWGVAFSVGWFALIFCFDQRRASDFEKKLKRLPLAMVLLASSFLALALSSSWEAALVRADFPD